MSTNLNSTSQYGPQLDKLRNMGVIAAIAGIVIAAGTLLGSLNAPVTTDYLNQNVPAHTQEGMARFYQAYLFAWLFWTGVTWGPVAILLLHNTVGGGWGFVLKRQLTAATENLPLMAALFLPLLIRWPGSEYTGLQYIYPWATPKAPEYANHHVVQHQQDFMGGWMKTSFVIIRQFIYFAILMFFAARINKLTWGMNKENAARNVEKLNQMSPICIVIYVIIVTLWAIDLIMTITPGWVTSIIGLLFVVGQGLSSWALFAALTSYVAGGKPPLSQVPTRYIRDIGNFTLAFTLLWSYMSYSQFLITFSGNQAEEALFYEWRQKGGWQIIGLLLLAAHFILPFLALLSSSVKTNINSLAKLGLIIIFMRFVDLYYWTAPTWNASLRISFLDIALPLAIGGIWIALWATNMKDKPLVPEDDHRLHGAWPLEHHHEHVAEGYEEVPEENEPHAEVAGVEVSGRKAEGHV
jgi:hypothetical protein